MAESFYKQHKYFIKGLLYSISILKLYASSLNQSSTIYEKPDWNLLTKPKKFSLVMTYIGIFVCIIQFSHITTKNILCNFEFTNWNYILMLTSFGILIGLHIVDYFYQNINIPIYPIHTVYFVINLFVSVKRSCSTNEIESGHTNDVIDK